MTRRVAITGLGFVTPLGTDVQSTWAGLVAGRSGAGPITRFDPVQSPVKFACEVKGFEPGRVLGKKEVRRADRELRQQGEAAGFFLVEETPRLEALDPSCQLHGALHGVEPRDRPGTGAARDQTLPGGLHVRAQGGDEPQARDRDPTRHVPISPSFRGGTATPVPPYAASRLPRPGCRCRIPSRRP